VGKEVKRDGVVQLEERCGIEESDGLLKERTFPIGYCCAPETTW